LLFFLAGVAMQTTCFLCFGYSASSCFFIGILLFTLVKNNFSIPKKTILGDKAFN
jgi:hypothetical protein